jgi:hypothetical protein
MANAVYPKYKEAVLGSAANSSLVAGVVKAALVDTATYTYSAAHEFQTSLAGVVGTAVTLGTKTVVNGAFDSADPTFAAVSGASAEAIVIYIDTGTPATSRLVAFLDTGFTGLPVTPSGGDITVAVNASGWFTL